MALFEKSVIPFQFAGRRDDESYEDYSNRTLINGRPADISWFRYFLLGDYEPTGLSVLIWSSLRLIPRLVVLSYWIFSTTFQQSFRGFGPWSRLLIPMCGLLSLPMTTLTYALFVRHDVTLLDSRGLPYLAGALIIDVYANYYSWRFELIFVTVMVYLQCYVSRLALIAVLIFTAWFGQVFPESMGIFAVLGFVLLPTTTLAYTFDQTHPSIAQANGWFFLTAGILMDFIVYAKLVRAKPDGGSDATPSTRADGVELEGDSPK